MLFRSGYPVGTVTRITKMPGEPFMSIEVEPSALLDQSRRVLIVSNYLNDDRKKMLYEKGLAGIVLPGGFGTLDEMFEMLTWNQLSIHNKRIYILNTAGFYDHLILHLEHLIEKDFLYEPLWERIHAFSNPLDLVNALENNLSNT